MNSYPTTSSMDDVEQQERTERHSIDQALELERALDNELSPPASPSHRPQSLDPQVLASIVTQLRLSFAEVSQERDTLASRLSEIQSRESTLAASLQETTEKCTDLTGELEKAQAKIKDDEEAISMLRAKVEESRRGLMKLQSESRRVTLDMSRAGAPMFGGPSSSNKRASFTPLTGSGLSGGHRRISSVSDSSFLMREFSNPDIPGSPGAQVLTFTDTRNSVGSPPSKASRRSSGFWGRPPPLEEPQPASSAELAALQREVKNLKNELEETRHELTEANEAKEASETCVKALRDFIAQNGVGGQVDDSGPTAPLRLPLPPSMNNDEDDGKQSSSGSGSGWGFKLWKVDTTISSQRTPMSALSPSKTVNIPTPQSSTPLARKLGGFFSSRSSVSSVNSTSSQAAPVSCTRETPYDNSDVSSVEDSAVEPISPASEVPQSIIMIRDERTPSSETFAMGNIAAKAGLDPISV